MRTIRGRCFTPIFMVACRTRHSIQSIFCSDQLAGWLSMRAAVWLHGHNSSCGSNPKRLKIFFSSVPAPQPRGAGFGLGVCGFRKTAETGTGPPASIAASG